MYLDRIRCWDFRYEIPGCIYMCFWKAGGLSMSLSPYPYAYPSEFSPLSGSGNKLTALSITYRNYLLTYRRIVQQREDKINIILAAYAESNRIVLIPTHSCRWVVVVLIGRPVCRFLFLVVVVFSFLCFWLLAPVLS